MKYHIFTPPSKKPEDDKPFEFPKHVIITHHARYDAATGEITHWTESHTPEELEAKRAAETPGERRDREDAEHNANVVMDFARENKWAKRKAPGDEPGAGGE